MSYTLTSTPDTMAMPMERLEARICELAGHLAAATCQFLLLIADFDARRGWASWEMPSCAAWLSWKCQIASGTAREHVRVARLLGALPLVRADFAAGRLSYAKVRALTRIATQETERDLLDMARPMTANQLERFAQAHRRVTRSEQEEIISRRKLTWRYDDDKAIGITLWLPPAEGAVVLQAIRAWTSDVEHPHDPADGGGPRTRAEQLGEQDARDGIDWQGQNPPWQKDQTAAADMADAIVAICGEFLSGRAAEADNPDTYQVIIHAGTGAITGSGDDGGDDGVSAETQPTGCGSPLPTCLATGQPHDLTPLSFGVTHPAYPMRCHVEDGLALSPATLQMIACNATISTMLHDATGTVLNVGRRTRRPPTALRRAARERDGFRCRYPGCESRRIDLHHIVFWSNGGETKLTNVICLCRRHHSLVHDKGVVIAATGGGFAFYEKNGRLIPASPPLPEGSPGAITTCHDAVISPSTIIPPFSGERLDLHLAIWTCFTNARIQAVRGERETARR
ncbi:HNH endonuclease signature motif containing protein [Trebonia sp.]|uniref:HNH endonuclease n=1 Tax=Trebonia sp. TaxID=2767075 RepID=UPI0026245E85|nr:HNH endonuclease signature motif containing protein [Trebonia sp.]